MIIRLFNTKFIFNSEVNFRVQGPIQAQVITRSKLSVKNNKVYIDLYVFETSIGYWVMVCVFRFVMLLLFVLLLGRGGGDLREMKMLLIRGEKRIIKEVKKRQ